MADVRVVGLDIAKSVFQIHGLDADGATVLQKRLTRARLLPFFEKLSQCLVGIEACATSHYWARELTKLGHDVKLMPAQYVKPYVKRQKNDMADAEAIAEAVTRPNMRFVVAKTPSEQSAMMLHKVRMMLNRQVVMLTNALRAHMAEFGIIAPVGRRGVDRLLTVIDDEADDPVPGEARLCLQMLAGQLKLVKLQILENDRRVLAAARSTELGRRLMEVPGKGHAHEVGKGKGATARKTVDTAGSDHPICAPHFGCAKLIRDRVRGRLYGQRRMKRPHHRPDTWPHRPPSADAR
jgi:transposase